MKTKTTSVTFIFCSFFLFTVSVQKINCQAKPIFNSNITYGTMTDIEGNVYKTVNIGRQTWMAENLRTTKYSDGSPIPLVTDDYEWNDLFTPAYCNYMNTNNKDSIAVFGRLYNWYTLDTRKLAPVGWHVASQGEWFDLVAHLGGAIVAGGKLKETGTAHWESPNKGATNEVGFTALPCGYRNVLGEFGGINDFGIWWSYWNDEEITAHRMGNEYPYLYFKSSYGKGCGFPVRCIKD